MRQFFIHVLLPLFIGSVIYLAARPPFATFWLGRSFTPHFVKYLPQWCVYNLPDGLWSYALLSATFLLWRNTPSVNARFWIISAFSLGILLEIAQYFHLIEGTFDWWDMGTYLIFNFFSIQQFKFKKDEKHF